MAGWCVTTCWLILILAFAVNQVGQFLAIRWTQDRQTRKARASRTLDLSDRNHARIRTRHTESRETPTPALSTADGSENGQRSWSSIFQPTLDVRPPARLKGERNEIEKLMAGWCVTTCWLILILAFAVNPVGQFLAIRWTQDRQTRKARTSRTLDLSDRNHAGARTRRSKNPRIRRDSELATPNHARRRLPHCPQRTDRKTAGAYGL